MTYSSVDKSIQSGNVVLLYQFTLGGVDYRFTNQSQDISANSNIWNSRQIRIRGSVQQSDDLFRERLQLIFNRDDVFAQTYLSDVQEFVTSVSIYRGYANDGEFILFWKGKIVNSKADAQEITLECYPLSASLERPGLRETYQRSCRWSLYGRGCNLDYNNFEFTTEIIDVDGLTLTVADADQQEDGYYSGGMIATIDSASEIFRFIKRHAGNQIEISSAYSEWVDPVGTTGIPVNIYAGCNRSLTICDSRFSNTNNFGGFPYIPRNNIFKGTSIA